jgi:hypothetical protein
MTLLTNTFVQRVATFCRTLFSNKTLKHSSEGEMIQEPSPSEFSFRGRPWQSDESGTRQFRLHPAHAAGGAAIAFPGHIDKASGQTRTQEERGLHASMMEATTIGFLASDDAFLVTGRIPGCGGDAG